MAAPLVVAAIGSAGMIVPRLKRATLWRWGSALGVLAAFADRNGSRVARANLRLVHGSGISDRRCNALIRAMHRTAARMLLDVFWFSRNREEKMRAWTAITPSMARILKKQPAILVSAHLGNWEIAVHILSRTGIPITSVAKDTGITSLTRAINRFRTATGQGVVSSTGAIRGLVRAMKKGRCPVLLLDQHTDGEDGGVEVDFMGHPAYVSGAAAVLARRFNTPVLVVFSRADASGNYMFYEKDTITARPGETVEELTQRIVDVLAAEIRRHPGMWMWMYKRWKRIPPGHDPADFPFYARPIRP